MKGFLASKPPASSGSSNSGKSVGVDTLVGRQTEILGDVRFSGGLHLDGKIKGSVSTTGDKSATLSISETGAIEGDVRVPNVVLNGSVTGDVRAIERLSLAAKAKVTGNVHYKVLQMEPGAQINGQLIYDDGSALVAALTHHLSAVPQSEGSTVVNLEDGSRVSTG
ncbi:MAG: polymer-forming cytoskeletal protein [Nevskia sp.]|nr:polymer-forming cytoskeletal protein [Nevskia sp.]